jgi:hypothetical protein
VLARSPGTRTLKTRGQRARPLSLSCEAVKKRGQRARADRGELGVNVTIHECRMAEAMIISGRLSEREAVDRAKLLQAIELLLVEFAGRWLNKNTDVTNVLLRIFRQPGLRGNLATLLRRGG